MKNLQTLAAELATSKMQLLVPNDMLNVRGGHHKGGSKKGRSKKSRKGTKKRSKYNNGCGCGNGNYGYGGY